MTEMVLVSCSKTKQRGTHLARDLYEPSPIFRKRRRLARHRNAHWGVLSARFGYLRPWDVTPYYDTHIDQRTEVWAAFVLRDLLRDLDFYEVETVTILAGRKYVDPLVTPLETRGYDVVDFNRGKMPGQRMQALDEAVAPGDQQELIPATDGGVTRDLEDTGNGRDDLRTDGGISITADELRARKRARSTTPTEERNRCPECGSTNIQRKTGKWGTSSLERGRWYCKKADCLTHFEKPVKGESCSP